MIKQNNSQYASFYYQSSLKIIQMLKTNLERIRGLSENTLSQ